MTTPKETREGGSTPRACSRNLRAQLAEVIQKFRDEEEYLLTDKSSRALGAAIAYGDMATELSKLVAAPDDAIAMRVMLARIAYPARNTPDDFADLNKFAAEIQATWSMEDLQANDKTQQPT